MTTPVISVTERAVHKHIANIFTKLDLPADDGGQRGHGGHRRVLAVLAYLNNPRAPDRRP